MAWLANLDAKSRTWPAPVRWPYVAFKWVLIALGAFAAAGLAYREIVEEHRIGLGTGIAVAVLLAVIKGVLMAVRSTPPAPPPPR